MQQRSSIQTPIFAKPKTGQTEAAPSPEQAPNPAPSSASKKGAKAGPSILGVDIRIEGILLSDGDLHVDAQIDGDMRAGSLTIGETAKINGNVFANDVTVRGQVVGSIRARKVTLTGSAHVDGEITHLELSVESGAYFNGSCRHAEDPLNTKSVPRPSGSKAA